MINEIAEDIDVLAQFGKGGLRPRVFVWGKRRHTVTAITASWSEREGFHRLLYFAVQTDGANVYELRYHTGKLVWSLVRIHTGG